jgi:hypothetical protein
VQFIPKRLLRNLGALLAGLLLAMGLAFLFGLILSNLAMVNHRAPEAYLPVFMLLFVPLAFLFGGSLSGWLAEVKVGRRFAESLVVSPGSYYGIAIILRAVAQSGSGYPGLTVAEILSGILIVCISILGLAAMRGYKIRNRDKSAGIRMN